MTTLGADDLVRSASVEYDRPANIWAHKAECLITATFAGSITVEEDYNHGQFYD